MTDAYKRAWLLAFVMLQIADCASTVHFIGNGRGIEANPIVSITMNAIGSWWIAPKMLVALGCAAILVKRPWVLAVMTILYGFVVLNNLML
jgi:hypothetical protein